MNRQDTKSTKRFFLTSHWTGVLAPLTVELKTIAWCSSCLGGSFIWSWVIIGNLDQRSSCAPTG